MQINRMNTGVRYPSLPDLKSYLEKIGGVRAEASVSRLGGSFTDIETESEMIRSAKAMIESAKVAQASLNHLLGSFGDVAMK